MNHFQSNIHNKYGAQGTAWLDTLPQLVATIASKWRLHELTPAANLSHNYVLSGWQGTIPVILKLSLDQEGLAQEAFALKCFAGFGAVGVIADDDRALLIERAIPGTSLKSGFPANDIDATTITCHVMQKLHHAPIPTDHHFPHITDWLAVLNKNHAIPDSHLQKAKQLRDQLLATMAPDTLLHGDLHHDNILQHGQAWVVIDPKGVIGEPAYEAAAFIRNPMPELLQYLSREKATAMIQNRIAVFAQNLNVLPNKITAWCFVQAVLSWVWALEDNSDSAYWKQTTDVLDGIAETR